MTDYAHDVGLAALFVDDEAFVSLTMNRIPALQGAVELGRIDADETIANDEFARDQVPSVPAAETLARLRAETFGPRPRWPCSRTSRKGWRRRRGPRRSRVGGAGLGRGGDRGISANNSGKDRI